MARATNGLGQFRGKVGSVVFRVSQGQQIASVYQPAVKNPKSNLQTAQRNKMYLASQISRLVPREDLIGLAPNGSVRDRRGLFVRNIINNTSSTLENGIFSSEINYKNVRFSNGIDFSGIAGITEGNNGEISIIINKNVVTEELFNRMAIKMIQLTIVNNVASLYKSAWLDLGDYDTTAAETFNVETSITQLPGANYVYFVPVVLSDGVRYSRELKTLIQANDENIVIQGVYETKSAVLTWYKTLSADPFTSDLPIVPPTGSDDEVVDPDGPNFPNLG